MLRDWRVGGRAAAVQEPLLLTRNIRARARRGNVRVRHGGRMAREDRGAASGGAGEAPAVVIRKIGPVHPGRRPPGGSSTTLHTPSSTILRRRRFRIRVQSRTSARAKPTFPHYNAPRTRGLTGFYPTGARRSRVGQMGAGRARRDARHTRAGRKDRARFASTPRVPFAPPSSIVQKHQNLGRR
jgi:hypothetical protein